MARASSGTLSTDPRLPLHVGIIMDGNGRWATRQGKSRSQGHRAGSRAVRAVVRACRSLGIPNLSLYAFSAQNWSRPQGEVDALMDLLGEFIAKEFNEIMRRDIRVVHLGDPGRIPVGVRRQLRALLRASRNNRSMTLALALNYGAREELVRAARKVAEKARQGRLRVEEIDAACLARALYTHGMPDPDLIIRTAGECRISNFLLWQSAYSELYFSPVLWPDFRKSDLLEALEDYRRRQRRFGLTDEQLLGPAKANRRQFTADRPQP